MHKRPKDTLNIVEAIYVQHKDWNAAQIYKKYKDDVGSEDNAVTLNAVQKIVQKLRINYEPIKDLDNSWSIGECAKPEYNIPAEMIPLLIEEAKLRMTTNLGPGDLTIGEAIWFSRLYHAVIQVAKQMFPDDNPRIWQGMVSMIAREYSYREMTSIINRKDIDTKDLDYWLFIKEDAETWKSLESHANFNLQIERDLRGIELPSEPKKIQSFTTYHKYLTKKETAEELQKLERMISEAAKTASERELLRRQKATGEGIGKDTNQEFLTKNSDKSENGGQTK